MPHGSAANALRRLALGGAGRVVLGVCVLALAALIVLGGGSALRGALGSLFGLQSGRPPAGVRTPPVAAQPVASRPATASAARRGAAAPRQRSHARHVIHRPAAPAPPASAPKQPAGPPAAPSPVSHGGGPVPGSGSGVVGSAGAGVQQVVQNLPAPLQPVVQPAVQQVQTTVTTACGVLGGCP